MDQKNKFSTPRTFYRAWGCETPTYDRICTHTACTRSRVGPDPPSAQVLALAARHLNAQVKLRTIISSWTVSTSWAIRFRPSPVVFLLKSFRGPVIRIQGERTRIFYTDSLRAQTCCPLAPVWNPLCSLYAVRHCISRGIDRCASKCEYSLVAPELADDKFGVPGGQL